MSRQRIAAIVAVMAALALVFGVAWAPAASAAPGDLDPTFGEGGIVKTPEVPLWTGLALEPNGRIVTYLQSQVARYRPFGALDRTFGEDGIVHGNFPLSSGSGSVEVLPDGRIVFPWGRLLADGSLDVLFETDAIDRSEAAGVQSDGKIVVAGTQSMIGACGTPDEPDLRAIFALTRFDQQGVPDPTFGNGGVVRTDVEPDDPCADLFLNAVVVQRDDRIVVVGALWSVEGLVVVRYDRDGLPDATFGTDGVVQIPGPPITWATDVAIAPDGRVVVAGLVGRHMAVARLHADGTLDDTFGTGGIASLPTNAFMGVWTALAVQQDGKVVIAGHGALGRLLADGSPDPGFGVNGVVAAGDGPVSLDVAVRPDGRIVTAGILYHDADLSHGGDAIVARYQGDTPDGPGACAMPRVGCRSARQPDRSILRLGDGNGPNADRLRWRWEGSREEEETFLDPSHTSGVTFCVYQRSPTAETRTLLSARVPAGDECEDRCWRSLDDRFVYRDHDGSVAGVTKIALDAGRRGDASITVLGRGPRLSLPGLPVDLPLTVQLQQDDGRCWEARYEPAGATKNGPHLFRASALVQ